MALSSMSYLPKLRTANGGPWWARQHSRQNHTERAARRIRARLNEEAQCQPSARQTDDYDAFGAGNRNELLRP